MDFYRAEWRSAVWMALYLEDDVGDQDSNPGSFDRGPNLTMDLRMVQY
jgi:hypothetical protein